MACQRGTSGKWVGSNGGSGAVGVMSRGESWAGAEGEVVAGWRYNITLHYATLCGGPGERSSGRRSGTARRCGRVVECGQKASSVAGMCSSTAEDIAVQQAPRGMPSGPGETSRNVVGWQWESRQPVRRQAGDGTMVGGGTEDKSEGERQVARRKTPQKAEGTSEGGG